MSAIFARRYRSFVFEGLFDGYFEREDDANFDLVLPPRDAVAIQVFFVFFVCGHV